MTHAVNEPQHFPWFLRKSCGVLCEHCSEPVDNGYLTFRPINAEHTAPNGDVFPCEHWLCLTCCSRITTKWTRDSGVVYKPNGEYR